MTDQDIHFSMAIPDDWERMDLTGRGRRDYARVQAQRVAEQIPALASKRKVIENSLYHELTSSWAKGVRYGAAMTQPTADGILDASITVSILPEPPHHDEESVFEAISATVHENDEDSDGDDESDVSMINLPRAGRAVRVLGHRTLHPGEGSSSLKYSILQTFIPFGGRVVMVMGFTFSSDVEDQLFELFDLITGTLSVWLERGVDK
ncbi:hypothetical protein [uncultured Bifidobacterium sp.]|uniref:hypothetical protein n=1 Tax=uncultured Bifidobacterium sp. TaxID=165187 RepID=UPI0025DFC53C|nr:hypothetical protein [uncultured Bifidobacterium sp.]